MTDEQINVTIAKACGWRHCKHDMRIAEAVHTRPYHGLVGIEPRAKEYDGLKDWHYWVIPAYATDLNAMHEGERARICGTLDMEYRKHLGDVCGQYQIIWHATARQRAEAFLRTLNLWTE